MLGNWRFTAKNMLKSCFHKKKFTDMDLAIKVAKKYNQHVYFCNICQHYHLTSREKPLRNTKFVY